MDLKEFADRFDPMTCVISVEKKPEGGYGRIRIVTGNQKYIDSIALAGGGVDVDSDKKVEFVPNSEYTKYIPKDLNFEDVCYRCAVLKEPKHNLVRMSRYSFDISSFFMPVDYEDKDLAYCTYSQVILPKEDNNIMAMNISLETATDVISTCIKLRGDKPFDEIMQEVIEDIRKICGAEFCCVLLMDDNLRKCTVLGEARADKSEHQLIRPKLGDDFYALAESWIDTMSESYCLVIRDADDMEFIKSKNPMWYKSLTDANVESLVLFPLFSRDHLLGYIWATNFDTEYTDRIKDTLEITTYFIASEIANNKFIDQLKMLNKTDLLTGVMNRNAMNNRIAELEEQSEEEQSKNCDENGEKPSEALCRMGVVFTDMNGLKYVNDHHGHMAGDMLLKNAAMILQSTFAEDEIYRAGGDEFLIILNDTNEAEMEEKIAEIKKKSEMFDFVSFSAGCCEVKDVKNIRDSLSTADANMYEDKDSYYRGGGIRR